METSLLTTKLNIPPLRLPLVSRPRLMERLQKYHNHSFILISAPAGFGKTTLLSEWAHHSLPRNHTAWVSLDDGDSDPIRFWDYFIAALRMIQPLIGKNALALLRTPQQLPVESMLTPLLNDLNMISQDLVLVLDDYHFIQSQPVHDGVFFMLEHLPPHVHLVIATRMDPPLPLARFRGKGMLLEIGTDDLRFSLEEVAKLLNELRTPKISLEDVDAINKRTEGWVVGLKMFALSMKGEEDIPGFIRAFSGGHRYIMDYLLEEVLQKQTLEVREFLLKTSILERLNSGLCDTVTKHHDSNDILLRLVRGHMFVVPLGESRQWYRYEHLFKELLRHRLETEFGSKIIPGLHRLASRWYEENRFLEDAIHHSLAAKDWERAMKLISIPEINIPTQTTLTMLNWLKQIPEELLRTNKSLCLNYVWALIFGGQFDVADSILHYLNQVASGDDHLQGEIAAARASIANNRGDFIHVEEYAKKALSLLPLSDISARGATCSILGTYYLRKSLLNEAEPLLKESYEYFRQVGFISGTIFSLTYLSVIAQMRGNLHKAEQMFKQAISMAEQNPFAGLAHMHLASIYYEWNELESAISESEHAIKLTKLSGLPVQDIAYLSMMNLHLVQGDFIAATKALKQADQILNKREASPPDQMRNAAFHILFARAQQDLESISMWVEKLMKYEHFLSIETSAVALYFFFDHIGKPAASKRLETAYQLCNQAGINYSLIVVFLLQALNASAPDSALKFLGEALAKGKPEGFIRIFVDFGSILAPLLKQAITQGIEPEYATKLLTIIEIEEQQLKTRRKMGMAFSFLSGRELEVLRLLAAGLSNQEIAGKLVISLNTTKTHIRHIFDKLEAKGRMQAIARAKELKVL